MLNKRWLTACVLVAVAVVMLACSPAAPATSEPAPETPQVTEAAPTQETTEPPTASGPTTGLPIQGGGPEGINASAVERLSLFTTLPLTDSVNTLAFTPNSATVVAATSGGVALFDVATEQQTNTLAAGTPVWGMAFRPDNLTLAMIPAEPGSTPVIWDLAANAASPLLADKLAGVTAIGFSDDNTLAATGSSSGVVTVYDLQTNGTPALWSADINTVQAVVDLQGGAPFPVTEVTFSPDGTQLAASSAGMGVLVIFKVSDGSVVNSGNAMGHIAGPVATAMLAPNDWSKVYWLSRANVIVVDLATNQEVGRFDHEDFIQGIAFSADGSLLATAEGATINGEFIPVISVWDTSNTSMLRQITGFSQVPSALAFSPDGSRLAVGLSGEGVELWGLVQNQ